MNYAVNHAQHIRNHLSAHKIATPSEIAAALPRSKRTKHSAQTIRTQMMVMCDRGDIVRLAQGVYALPLTLVDKADAVTRGSPIGQLLVAALRERPHGGLSTRDLCGELLNSYPDWQRAHIAKALAKLNRNQVVRKTNGRWFLTCSAPDAVAKRDAIEIDIFS